jgi:hypothetical protein
VRCPVAEGGLTTSNICNIQYTIVLVRYVQLVQPYPTRDCTRPDRKKMHFDFDTAPYIYVWHAASDSRDARRGVWAMRAAWWWSLKSIRQDSLALTVLRGLRPRVSKKTHRSQSTTPRKPLPRYPTPLVASCGHPESPQHPLVHTRTPSPIACILSSTTSLALARVTSSLASLSSRSTGIVVWHFSLPQ